MGRPHGPVRLALLAAAAEPGTVRELAQRALVGLNAARYSASRMVARGQLVVLELGRPAVLAVPDAMPPAAEAGQAAAAGIGNTDVRDQGHQRPQALQGLTALWWTSATRE